MSYLAQQEYLRTQPSGRDDPLTETLGLRVFAANYMFPGLAMPSIGWRASRLRVSRYYWDPERPTAIDFRRDLRYGDAEAKRKAAFFAERSITYYLLVDEWDVEGVRAADEGPEVRRAATKPMTAPRRKKEA